MKRFLRRILAGLVVLLAGLGAHAAKKPAPAGAWIADFRRYVMQEKLTVESADAPRAAERGVMTTSDLLRGLPEPAEWPQLRLNLIAAAARAPAGVEQQRLQAGVWLLDYLLGDRAKLLANLPAAGPADPSVPPSRQVSALAGLRSSLAAASEAGNEASPEAEVDEFEQQLMALEPLDLDEVKRALGGEENFARLQRLLAGGEVMNRKMAEVYDDYKKSKDKAAAKKQMEGLTREFTAQYGADRATLAPYMEKPVVERYLGSLGNEPEKPDDSVPSIAVPDLVKIVGHDEATILLQRALHLPAMLMLGEKSGVETSRLARALARNGIVDLKVPAWGLTQAVDQGPFFEALLERFAIPDARDNHYRDFQVASGYFLASLIQDGRTRDAVTFASRPGVRDEIDLPDEVMESLEKSGQAPVLWEFLRDWLGQFPLAPEWDRFNRLSAQLGRQDELKAQLKAMASGGAFAGRDRLRVQERQAGAELATDDLAAAVSRLREVVAPPAVTPRERAGQLETIVKLLQLADLRADVAGLAHAQAAGEALLEKTWEEAPAEALDDSIQLVTALNSVGRTVDGHRIGRTTLEKVAAFEARTAAGTREQALKNYLPGAELPHLLGEQLRTAVELGRWPEAMALVQENPGWNVADASALLREKVVSNQVPVCVYFAEVALHQKDMPRARQILEAQLAVTPGADAVYAAYVGLGQKDARSLLEKLTAADRYEERPLIWQARLLLDAKKWDAASVILQQAINVDPSDGEQGRGDRMRVYAFMAEAMKGKGDATKAKFFEDVVKSIRLSETADRWFAVGAYARATAIYREALGFFADAYCIQSRLAVRLADEGRVDEAAEHYRRAFELMPDSFGRVESHCFGCEHVFAGEKMQGMAEQVFTTMLAARPDKPQLHYLMGYLRIQQGRGAEAADHFRRAVALDPLYLNAWAKLAGLESAVPFTTAQRDDLQLKLLELDPTRHRASFELSPVSDLVRLWPAMAAANRLVAALPPAGPLWELKASAARLGGRGSKEPSPDRLQREKDFAAVLLKHRFVDAWQAYLVSLNAPREPEGEEMEGESPVISAY